MCFAEAHNQVEIGFKLGPHDSKSYTLPLSLHALHLVHTLIGGVHLSFSWLFCTK